MRETPREGRDKSLEAVYVEDEPESPLLWEVGNLNRETIFATRRQCYLLLQVLACIFVRVKSSIV